MSPQESIGHYRIIAKLGEGGMGAVYRAADTKLNREVAIKVLPDTLANDPDYLARSTREAQVLASLNHPNIAIIYGVEERALVMELVPGQTLEERIAAGPVPLEEALDIARQIAEALDAAHEKGVIHRDLKPANVKVTPEGVVKVLDFGLAKAMDPVSPVSTANSPTLTMRATQVGIIMGTAGYMAPEQAAGKPVDRRADIWSFGVLLYEMLTGARLFDDGESISHTLADVLRREIDFSRLSPGTPPAIRQLLQRCLDRKLRTRLQHIGEARIAIETAVTNPRAADEPRRPAPVLWMAATAVCLAAAVAGWVAWTRKTAPPPPAAKFELQLPIRGGDLALSPDGKTLAYRSSDGGGAPSIYLRPLDSLESKPLAGTAGADRPFWSPDGKSLAYGASGKLYRVDVAGGVPTRICDLPGFAGGTWSDQDVILAAVDAVGLVRVAASGGGAPPTLVLKLPSPSAPIVFPQFLPGGSQFLYMRLRDPAQRGAYLASLDGQPGTRILDAPYRVVYDSNSGRLLYAESNGAVMARHLDLNPPALTGEAVTVAEHVRVDNGSRNLEASVSTNGILCYVRGSEAVRTAFAWHDRSGKLLGIIGQPVEVIGSFDISPDQRRLAYTSGPQERTIIWIMDLTGGLTTRVTFNDSAVTPRWSPDGKYVYYRSHGLARKAADGSGEEEILNPGREEALGPGILTSLSADGKFALMGLTAVSLVPLIPGGKAEPLVDNKARAGNGSFSPDGRWIAYNSDESGRNEIHVQGFPDRRGKWVVSSDGGLAPRWRADGKELYWVSPEGMLTAVPIELGSAALRSGRPVSLFAVPQAGTFRYFQPSPDGSKFLTYEPERESSRTEPGVVVHIGWSSSLPK